MMKAAEKIKKEAENKAKEVENKVRNRELELAKALKTAEVPIDFIAKTTGLSIEEIEGL